MAPPAAMPPPELWEALLAVAQRAVGGVADTVAGVDGLVGDVDRRVEGGGQGECQQKCREQTTDRDNHAKHGGGSFELLRYGLRGPAPRGFQTSKSSAVTCSIQVYGSPPRSV